MWALFFRGTAVLHIYLRLDFSVLPFLFFFFKVERLLKDSVDKLAEVNEGMTRRLTKLEKDISTEVHT